MTSRIAIIGAGPAGCMAACCLDKSFDITLFDKSAPLLTLLPTGGGRCNLAHAEYDFKELAKNYPRGEKFLYSVFSRFSTTQTLDFFEKIGVKTYTQDNNRIFPISNSAKEVREKMLAQIKHCHFVKEEITQITPQDNGFKLTSNHAGYIFDKIIIAIGGKSGTKLLEPLNISLEKQYPALVGLKTKPNNKNLQGVSIKNVKIKCDKKEFCGDLLFTNDGLSGPVIYELSSLNAKKTFPYTITIDFYGEELDLQEYFDKNPQKNLSNLLTEFLPKSCVIEFLKENNVELTQKCYEVKSNTKVLVKKFIQEKQYEIIGTRKDGETVTCGGISLNEIDSKTMALKKYKNIYVCGEIMDVDGLCGGFNLQNCWSTGNLTANSINQSLL